MKRRMPLALIAVALAATVGVSSAGAAATSMTVQSADTAQFPSVKVSVVLPATVTAAGEPAFTVTENGKSVQVESVRSVRASDEPLDAILVLDASGSMKGEAFERAKEAAKEFAAAMPDGSGIALITISTRPRVVLPFTDNRGLVTSAIDRLDANGETALYDALAEAASLAVTSKVGVAGIVVLSDGGDTTSRLSGSAVSATLDRARVPIYSVALPSYEADPVALRSLSKHTGGRLVSISRLDELPTLYRGLAEEFSNRYVVSYRSRRPATKQLEVSLEAKGGELTASAVTVIENPMAVATPTETGATLTPGAPNPFMYIGVIGMVWVSVTLLGIAVILFLIRPRTTISQVAYYEQTGVEGSEATRLDPNSIRAKMLEAVGYVAGSRGFTELVRQRLERAGLPLRPVEYIAAHLVLVIVSGVAVVLVTNDLLLAIVTILVATGAPMIYIDIKAKNRKQAFEEQLPDVLDLLAGSLRAGWGIQQAIDLVVTEMLPPVSEEFKRVQTEARLGLPLEEALAAMAERVDSEDFRWTVSAISIQREVGGNLAEVLGIVAETIREREALKRHVRGLTAEGRLSAYILIGLPIVETLLLYVVNRRYAMILFTTVPGLAFTGVGLLLMIVGWFWLQRAMTVEV